MSEKLMSWTQVRVCLSKMETEKPEGEVGLRTRLRTSPVAWKSFAGV